MKITRSRTIETGCYGIAVHLFEKGSASITSNLLDRDERNGCDRLLNVEYKGAMHAIESLVLAHAIAGIDITDPAYLEGVETAVEACANNFILEI